jgi:hypothetical protein
MTYDFSDKTLFYFFHNVYGDVDSLLSSKPSNVVSIPFGWTQAVEENRQSVLTTLNATVSELPSLAFWVDQYEFERFDIVYNENVKENVNAHWEVLSIPRGVEGTWTWEKIQSKIDTWKANKTGSIND